MINFAKKIDKLNKFIIKAIDKAILAGEKIIVIYDDAGEEIEKLKLLLKKLHEVKNEFEK